MKHFHLTRTLNENFSLSFPCETGFTCANIRSKLRQSTRKGYMNNVQP